MLLRQIAVDPDLANTLVITGPGQMQQWTTEYLRRLEDGDPSVLDANGQPMSFQEYVRQQVELDPTITNVFAGE